MPKIFSVASCFSIREKHVAWALASHFGWMLTTDRWFDCFSVEAENDTPAKGIQMNWKEKEEVQISGLFRYVYRMQRFYFMPRFWIADSAVPQLTVIQFLSTCYASTRGKFLTVERYHGGGLFVFSNYNFTYFHNILANWASMQADTSNAAKTGLN